jgi:Protein tyrosine and serine/threonine kinase
MARLLAVRDNTRCPKPADMSTKLWECVEACWSTLPQDRPTMAQFVQSFAVASDADEDHGYDLCDDYSDLHTWDGRPNPRMPFDLFQMSCEHYTVSF